MNLKKKIREFFTLTRKANGGFTLVELIVVIAILAILAGVAVPAYSGYITQTNKQADVTLAKDIEHALILGYYEGTVVPGAYVIVSPDADVTVSEGNGAAEAMTAAFGSGYESLRLKYNGWDNSVVDVVEIYKESVFQGNEQGLLEDVQTLTNAFEEFVDKLTPDELKVIAGDTFNEFLSDNDIEGNQAIANSLGLYAAYRSGGADKTAFLAAWKEPSASNAIDGFKEVPVGTDGDKLGTVAGLAAAYARGEAVLTYIDQQLPNVEFVTTAGEKYPSLCAWFRAQPVMGNTVAEVEDAIKKLTTDTLTYINNAPYKQHMLAYFATGQADKDAEAYLALMGAVEQSTPAMKNNLDSTTMYNDGTMKNFLDSYIAAGDILAADGNSVLVRMQENGTAIAIPLYNLGLMN